RHYGLPTRYQIIKYLGGKMSEITVIHADRLIRFDGSELPPQQFQSNTYWHDSVLNALYEAIRDYSSSHGSAAHIIESFTQTVYKLKGLVDILSAGQGELVEDRFKVLDTIRSVYNSVILDEEEDFNRIGAPVTGLHELVDKITNRL